MLVVQSFRHSVLSFDWRDRSDPNSVVTKKALARAAWAAVQGTLVKLGPGVWGQCGRVTFWGAH